MYPNPKSATILAARDVGETPPTSLVFPGGPSDLTGGVEKGERVPRLARLLGVEVCLGFHGTSRLLGALEKHVSTATNRCEQFPRAGFHGHVVAVVVDSHPHLSSVYFNSKVKGLQAMGLGCFPSSGGELRDDFLFELHIHVQGSGWQWPMHST